ncbi:hypothetical protein H1C71_023166 [Ictidomys tridecemlineatus]|nr:hypothetical protein H1C71_023166 [Ictidomys tridecemlineatus]
MALSVETESHIYRALRTASGAAAHLVALGFTIFVAVLARPGSSLFSWHPVLMSLAVSSGYGQLSWVGAWVWVVTLIAFDSLWTFSVYLEELHASTLVWICS